MGLYPVTICCDECDEVFKGWSDTKYAECWGCGKKHKVILSDGTAVKDLPPVKESDLGAAPVKKKTGATAACQDYYNSIIKKLKKGKVTRAQAVQHMVTLGVNKGTASTQFSRFAKEKL